MLTRPHPFQHRTKSMATQVGFWLLVSVLVLLLTACGGGSDPAPTPTPTPAPIPTATITGATSDTATQPGDIAHDGNTDDTTPTLQGTLSAALTGTQRVYVYNGDSRLTEQATVTGTQWVFTPAAPLVLGTHRFTAEVADGAGAASARSAAYVVKMVAAAKLPDTGITAAQCYAADDLTDALVSCTSAAAMALNDQQDGMVGRDVTNPSNTDGKLGFSYSTVGSYSKEECVKDNITGLTWEGKPTTGFRAASSTYTHYDSTTAAQFWNGTAFVNPTQAQIDAATNTMGYVAAVNAAKLCGYSDWRLPSADELQGLVDYSVDYPGPTIDGTWFPNTQQWSYWAATGVAGDSGSAWFVPFETGLVFYDVRYDNNHVRLVR